METSDESFAWTDASSDSSKDNMLLEMKQNKPEKNSDKDEAHKNESHSGAETVQVVKKHKLKKKKQHEVHEEINDQIARSMESEPNSYSNEPKSRKRHKCDETSVNSNYDESFHEAEDYLNLRVKQEQLTFVEPTPVKKKKKKGKDKVSEDREMELCMPSKDEINFEEHNLDGLSLVNGDPEIDTSFRKKKKKKKKTSTDNDMSEILEDSEDYHKTKKKNLYKKLSHNDASDDDNFQHDVDNNSQIISSTLSNHSNKENVKEECNDDIQSVSTMGNSTTSTSQKSGKIEGTFKKACRISDRLRFEEDSLDYELNKVSKKDISNELEQFISSNINLKPLEANLHGDADISDDDEVWILKGPHDISIADFENAKLSLDAKKKVKLNGNTYDAFIDTAICAAPILLFNKTQVFLKNMPLKGVINLRKRVPKIHIPYESLIMNNESSFIPLPETKCRHPLFGIDYKKAAKVPMEIAERLNASTVSDTDGKNKKIYKDKHEIESDIEVKPNIEVLHCNKKKRKLENGSDIEAKPNIEELHSYKKKRKTKEKLDIESDLQVKPDYEEQHSKNKKRKVEIESDIEVKGNNKEPHSNKKKRKMKERCEIESDNEVKPSIEELHSKKKKKKSKERCEIESDNEVKPSIEELHSKKKKKISKERCETESDTEVKLNIERSHSNKKKRKHSDERTVSKAAKRAKRDLGSDGRAASKGAKGDLSSAEAWGSEQAIEQNLFDF